MQHLPFWNGQYKTWVNFEEQVETVPGANHWLWVKNLDHEPNSSK